MYYPRPPAGGGRVSPLTSLSEALHIQFTELNGGWPLHLVMMHVYWDPLRTEWPTTDIMGSEACQAVVRGLFALKHASIIGAAALSNAVD